GVGLSEGVGLGVGLSEGVGLGVGLSEGVGLGVGLSGGVGPGVGLSEGVGPGVGLSGGVWLIGLFAGGKVDAVFGDRLTAVGCARDGSREITKLVIVSKEVLDKTNISFLSNFRFISHSSKYQHTPKI
ncbi:MAG: hypothetical protein V7L05_05005, partial [Nostoc sp.]|uniref:hypothetical protein n=2 Tax=Nostoc sp. TaxID=1180 RepID=UPI002FFAFAA9